MRAVDSTQRDTGAFYGKGNIVIPLRESKCNVFQCHIFFLISILKKEKKKGKSDYIPFFFILSQFLTCPLSHHSR